MHETKKEDVVNEPSQSERGEQSFVAEHIFEEQPTEFVVPTETVVSTPDVVSVADVFQKEEIREQVVAYTLSSEEVIVPIAVADSSSTLDIPPLPMLVVEKPQKIQIVREEKTQLVAPPVQEVPLGAAETLLMAVSSKSTVDTSMKFVKTPIIEKSSLQNTVVTAAERLQEVPLPPVREAKKMEAQEVMHVKTMEDQFKENSYEVVIPRREQVSEVRPAVLYQKAEQAKSKKTPEENSVKGKRMDTEQATVKLDKLDMIAEILPKKTQLVIKKETVKGNTIVLEQQAFTMLLHDAKVSVIKTETTKKKDKASEKKNTQILAIQSDEKMIIGAHKKEPAEKVKKRAEKNVDKKSEQPLKVPDITPITTLSDIVDVARFLTKLDTKNDAKKSKTSEQKVNEKKTKPEVVVVVSDEIIHIVKVLQEKTEQPKINTKQRSEKIADTDTKVSEESVVTFMTASEDMQQVQVSKDILVEIQAVVAVIDTLSLPDTAFTKHTPGEVVKSQKRDNGEIVLGVTKSKEITEAVSARQDTLAAVTTIDQLEQTLAVIDTQLSQTIEKKNDGGILKKKEANERKPLIIVPFEKVDIFVLKKTVEKKLEKGQITVVVSDALLNFFESGKEALAVREKTKKKTEKRADVSMTKEQIKLSSTEKELLIELETFKTLLQLAKIKQHLEQKNDVMQQEEEQFSKETYYYSTAKDDEQAVYLFYHTLLNMLAGTVEEYALSDTFYQFAS